MEDRTLKNKLAIVLRIWFPQDMKLALLFSFNVRGETLLVLIKKNLHLCRLGLQAVFCFNIILSAHLLLLIRVHELKKSAVKSNLSRSPYRALNSSTLFWVNFSPNNLSYTFHSDLV